MCTLSREKLSNYLLIEENQQKMRSIIFRQFSPKAICALPEINPNFTLSILLEAIDVIVEDKTFGFFVDNIIEIEELVKFTIEFNSNPKAMYSNALISLMIFLRKVMGFLEAFTPSFKVYIFEKLFKLCCGKVKSLFLPFSSQADDEVLVDEVNELFIVELAETLGRFLSS